jgi:hypothetical protein
MIAYRAEIWCDGVDANDLDRLRDGGPRTGAWCRDRAGWAQGIAHDDPYALLQLAKNREAILLKEGWSKEGDKHFCPRCTKVRAKGKAA